MYFIILFHRQVYIRLHQLMIGLASLFNPALLYGPLAVPTVALLRLFSFAEINFLTALCSSLIDFSMVLILNGSFVYDAYCRANRVISSVQGICLHRRSRNFQNRPFLFYT